MTRSVAVLGPPQLTVRAMMKYGPSSILILASAIGALASPTQNVLSVSKPRPLVIWHGLGAPALFPGILVRVMMSPAPTGDSYDSSGLLKFQSAIEEMHRGIFIHSVYVDPDSKKDQHATLVRSEYTQSSSSMTFLTFIVLRTSTGTSMSRWNS